MAKTAYRKPKKKVHAFDIVNYIVFILIGLLVLVPIWKVVVDSFMLWVYTSSDCGRRILP